MIPLPLEQKELDRKEGGCLEVKVPRWLTIATKHQEEFRKIASGEKRHKL